MLQQNRNVNDINLIYLFCSRQDLLLTGDSGDLGEGELEQNLLLVIDNVHPGPVDSDDDVVLGQIWS